METDEQKLYRAAAEDVWELSHKYEGHPVAEDLKLLSQELHAKAAGLRSMLPSSPGDLG